MKLFYKLKKHIKELFLCFQKLKNTFEIPLTKVDLHQITISQCFLFFFQIELVNIVDLLHLWLCPEILPGPQIFQIEIVPHPQIAAASQALLVSLLAPMLLVFLWLLLDLSGTCWVNKY